MIQVTRCDWCGVQQKCAPQGGQMVCERCCPALHAEVKAEMSAAQQEAFRAARAEAERRQAVADARWTDHVLPPEDSGSDPLPFSTFQVEIEDLFDPAARVVREHFAKVERMRAAQALQPQSKRKAA